MAAIYPLVLFLHGLNRWFVAPRGSRAAAVGGHVAQPHEFGGDLACARPWRAYMGTLRLQFVLGVLLLFISPLAQAAWADMGDRDEGAPDALLHGRAHGDDDRRGGGGRDGRRPGPQGRRRRSIRSRHV